MSESAQNTPRTWDQPEGSSFEQWMESRVARFSTRKYDFDALKFQADFDPKYRRGQMRYIGTGGTGVAADSNTIPAEQLNLTTGWVIPEHGVTFGWRGEFADRQYSYSTAGATRGNVSAPTKSYSVHNLFVSYRAVSGPLEGIEARLNWDNIFDEYYQPHLSYLPSAGQTFRMSLAKTF